MGLVMKTDILTSELSNRRTFLRSAAASGLLALSPRWLRSQGVGHKSATLYVTDAREKYAERPELCWTAAAARVRGATIEIDSTREYQPILGFGAALTEASCFLLRGMPAAARHAFLTRNLFPPGLEPECRPLLHWRQRLLAKHLLL